MKDAVKLLEGNEANLLLQGEDILYVVLFWPENPGLWSGQGFVERMEGAGEKRKTTVTIQTSTG